MSYCTKCGAQIPEGSRFCSKCGAPVLQGTSDDSVNINQQQSNNIYQDSHADYDPDYVETASQQPKMKWFKFLIYFYLFLTAVSCLFNAGYYGLGFLYGEYRASFYADYPGMRIVNIVYGVYFLAIGIMAIYVRQQLAHQKENGPKLYIEFLLLSCAGILYTVISSAIMGYFTISGGIISVTGLVFALSLIFVLVWDVAYLMMNITYFNKRSGLFIQ